MEILHKDFPKHGFLPSHPFVTFKEDVVPAFFHLFVIGKSRGFFHSFVPLNLFAPGKMKSVLGFMQSVLEEKFLSSS